MSGDEITAPHCECRYRVEANGSKTITSICEEHLTAMIERRPDGRSAAEWLVSEWLRRQE